MKNIYTCFPEGKYKVLTMSYDDGCQEDRRLVEIMNRNGIRGTFHLNSGLPGANKIPASEWKELYRGHEVSCHTVLHPVISRCPLDQVALQILEDRRALERAVGYPVRGLSYPCGSYSREIVALLPGVGIEYARTTRETGNCGMPEDFLTWEATCHHNHSLLERAREFAALNAPQHLFMLYVWGHSYEFTNDNNWGLIEEFCSRMGCRDDIWYATNIEIVDYMKAARSLKFTVEGDMAYNPGAQDVWIRVGNDVVKVGGGQTVCF
ncbi:MAG TPA: polysaccharide deacetylase family protein [Candidatus Eisenbergiella merdipullorum]|uniref:Polysaccharide deacetylase family protein n=1 Tax=Candidatus Eisenbergiella merdipullorum TaxID=2838553 RepID=A0A9D2I979_9FIRM|nr:polysaccharide deacetylase family protein [Candidatus Eisenbergiella merdipullorum]